MTIYLDNCCLNRPFDDQVAPRVRLEAEAIELIFHAISGGRMALLWSDVLDIENGQNPFEERQAAIARWKESATAIIKAEPSVRERAQTLARDGFKALDALHLASAAAGRASHFLTVDDGVLRKRGLVREIIIASPLEFVQSFGEQL